MKSNFKHIVFFGILLLAQMITTYAFADIDDVADEGNTLGDMIVNTVNSISNLPDLVAFFAYLTGVVFAAVGIHKLRLHVILGPQQAPLEDSLKLLFVGGLMLSLPSIAMVAYNTFGGVGEGQAINDLGWDTTAIADGGVDSMLFNFMQSIYYPMQILIEFFCYVAGAVLMLVAVHRFTKTAQEGATGPTGLGTIATFVLAGVLFSIGPSVGTMTETLFGGRDSMLSVDFMALDESMGAGSAHAQNVIVSILAFLVIVGILSVIRGFFVLRGVAEGDQQSTMMGGVSHVIAGAILVNFGQFANIIQNTLGISGFGVEFN